MPSSPTRLPPPPTPAGSAFYRAGSIRSLIDLNNGGPNTAQRWQCPSPHPMSKPSITFNVDDTTPAKGTKSWQELHQGQAGLPLAPAG